VCTIRPSVRGIQLLGIDPLEGANEGKVVMGYQRDAENILKNLKSHRYGRDAAIVGTVIDGKESLWKQKLVANGY
jgi:hydrogenase expression/formation protein HypE